MSKFKKSSGRKNYWRSQIVAYYKSNLNQREYCRQNKISYWSFNSWKCKLESEENDLQEVPSEIVKSLSFQENNIEILLEKGIKISVPSGFSKGTLREVLHILGVE